MRTKEAILQVSAAVGDTSVRGRFQPERGRIIGAVIFSNETTNEFVNARIKSDDGTIISDFQHIKNYRSRDCEYQQGGKPLDFETGGKTYHLEIEHTNTANGFSNDFTAQLIFIYEDQRCL